MVPRPSVNWRWRKVFLTKANAEKSMFGLLQYTNTILQKEYIATK